MAKSALGCGFCGSLGRRGASGSKGKGWSNPHLVADLRKVQVGAELQDLKEEMVKSAPGCGFAEVQVGAEPQNRKEGNSEIRTWLRIYGKN